MGGRNSGGRSISSKSVPVAVVPVLPGIVPEVQNNIQEDAAYAVNFLEETTGLRYYPVPTLLVDQQIVKSVRSIETIDISSQATSVDQAFALFDILKSIQLNFHSRKWYPDMSYYDQWEDAFGKGRLVSEEIFDYLRGSCEWEFPSGIESYIQPEWKRASIGGRGETPDTPKDHSYSEFILATFESIPETAEPERRRSEYEMNFWRRPEEEDLLENQLLLAGINLKSDEFSISVKDSFSNLLSALGYYHSALKEVLPLYDDVNIGLASEQVPNHQEHVIIAKIVRDICRQILSYDSPGHSLGTWLSEMIDPMWRSMRDALIKLEFNSLNHESDFIEFATVCFNTIHHLLLEGLRKQGDFNSQNGYFINKSSWEYLKTEFPEIRFLVETSKYDEEKLFLEGMFSEFVRIYGQAKDRLLAYFSQHGISLLPLERLFVVQTTTYGIHVTANSQASDDRLKQWAFEKGIRPELTLPQNSRVLFCLTALDQFEKELEHIIEDRILIRKMARDFQRSVLVHEHFHAIVETGRNQKNLNAFRAFPEDAWCSALTLNESLAAWMQLHAARNNSELKKLVWSYIRADAYPHWPYRGAEKIEELYQKCGIKVVRSLIRSLRRAPEGTQKAFDSIIKIQ